MLTRAAVAKRLGKSIATVRRLEGRALHPTVDDNGVHRFSHEEVQDLAQRVRDGLVPLAARGAWLNRPRGTQQRRRGAALHGAMGALERAVTEAQQEVAMTALALLSNRELRRLSHLTEYLESLLAQD